MMDTLNRVFAFIPVALGLCAVAVFGRLAIEAHLARRRAARHNRGTS
ncbi:MAG: hypothetical protein HOY79_16475 [Streptomyces sp.]|nr:hypothetical protein [Streptomyces sp.]